MWNLNNQLKLILLFNYKEILIYLIRYDVFIDVFQYVQNNNVFIFFVQSKQNTLDNPSCYVFYHFFIINPIRILKYLKKVFHSRTLKNTQETIEPF